MKHLYLASLFSASLLFSLSSCNESVAEAKGVMAKPKVVEVKGDTVIKLNDGEACTVIQNKKDGHMFMVGNIDGKLQAVQLGAKGQTPVSVKIRDNKEAEISVQREDNLIYVDNDGDGIVDIKLDNTGRYKVKEIIWEKIDIQKNKENKQE